MFHQRKPRGGPKPATRNAGLAFLKFYRAYKGDDCLLFPFRTTAQPRGTVTLNFKMTPAHRAMCTLAHGLPESDGMQAIHKCGNGHLGCVNPNHLRWGTPSENRSDAHKHAAEGRYPEPTEAEQRERFRAFREHAEKQVKVHFSDRSLRETLSF